MSLDDAMNGCGGIIPKFNAMIYLILVLYLYVNMLWYLLLVYYQTGMCIKEFLWESTEVFHVEHRYNWVFEYENLWF